MKYKNCFKLVVTLAALLSCAPSFAQKVGNGGDMCADHILTIAANIDAWIAQGNGSKMILPSGITPSSYQFGMHQSFLKTKVSCTNRRVKIGKSERTCKNYTDSRQVSRIVCNRRAFEKETGDSDQYVLIHHELAGVAGFEKDVAKETSDFTISRQLSGKGRQVLVYKLAITGDTNTVCPANAALVEGTCVVVTGSSYTLSQYGLGTSTVASYCQSVPLTLTEVGDKVSGTGATSYGCTGTLSATEKNGILVVDSFNLNLSPQGIFCSYQGILNANGNSLTGTLSYIPKGGYSNPYGDSLCGATITIGGTKTN